jgi:hypothetical protein
MKGSVPFPAVTILQKTDWPTQAELEVEVNSPECFLGQYNTTASLCSQLEAKDLATISKCRCTDGWNTTLGGFSWARGYGDYASLDFSPTGKNEGRDMALSPTEFTVMMLLKTSFYYNVSAARASTQTHDQTIPSPGLYLALYDYRLNLTDALTLDLAKLIDINALGVSSINLSIEERENGTFHYYYYDPSVTSIPSMNISCDISNGIKADTQPCTTFLYVRMPGNKRTVVKYTKALNWGVSRYPHAYRYRVEHLF